MLACSRTRINVPEDGRGGMRDSSLLQTWVDEYWDEIGEVLGHEY
jgi:hypothetical protein